MSDWTRMDKAALASERETLEASFETFKQQRLALDMTRGKPCPEQLDLSLPMLTAVGPEDYRTADGTDARNYGGVDGLPEAKKLFADFLGVGEDEVLIGGNASLQLMHDTVVRCLTHGPVGASVPWSKLPKVRFLCPSPGYDRHFAICEHFGIEMTAVEMTEDGPDMDAVEALAREDESVKGIWCVPRYSNPTGAVYSDKVVERLASMKTAAPDFRIFWDNAYAVHHLADQPKPLKNILDACKAAGTPDRPFLFGSTSKITFAGAGLAVLGGSAATLDWTRSHAKIQTIGPDKLNQLRHVRFLKDMHGVNALMKKHAAILRPKFDAVLEALERDLGGTGLATWSRPEGGYFVSLDVPDGCARAVVAKAGEAGVKLTPAGATFPYGKDPRDRNLRIAPTLPGLEEIKTAMQLLTLCVRLVGAEKLLEQ